MASDEPGARKPAAGGETPPRFSALLAGPAVIPVLSIKTADDAVPLARALIDGGLRVLEVTLRTDCGSVVVGQLYLHMLGRRSLALFEHRIRPAIDV